VDEQARTTTCTADAFLFFCLLVGWPGHLVPLKSAKVLAFGADEIAPLLRRLQPFTSRDLAPLTLLPSKF
jgi:hypothetical protein